MYLNRSFEVWEEYYIWKEYVSCQLVIPNTILGLISIFLTVFLLRYKRDYRRFSSQLIRLILISDLFSTLGKVFFSVGITIAFRQDDVNKRFVMYLVILYWFFGVLGYVYTTVYNVALNIMKSINITNPFHRINFFALKISLIAWCIIWGTFAIIDCIFLVKKPEYWIDIWDALRLPQVGATRKVLRCLCNTSCCSEYHGPVTASFEDCEFGIVFGQSCLQLFLPTLIIMLSIIVQIVNIHKTASCNVAAIKGNRHVNITLLLILGSFLVCNIPVTVVHAVMSGKDLNDKRYYGYVYDRRILPVLGIVTTTLPILNTSFMSGVLIVRNKRMKNLFLSRFFFRYCLKQPGSYTALKVQQL